MHDALSDARDEQSSYIKPPSSGGKNLIGSKTGVAFIQRCAASRQLMDISL